MDSDSKNDVEDEKHGVTVDIKTHGDKPISTRQVDTAARLVMGPQSALDPEEAGRIR